MENQYPALLIGVDGGGSKTVVLLADGQGHVLGRGTGGPSNYQVVGLQAAGAALSQAMRAAFSEANLEPRAPAAICLGLSGVDRPADQAVIQTWVNEEMPGTPAAIVNDAELVLAAGTPEGWGLALICGTGSIAYGRTLGGQAARAGGWGYLLGDEGSGYAIGMAALRAVARASDGRASQTILTRSILEHWSLTAPQELIGRIYQERIPTQEIAALARLVDMAASDQDQVAQRILQEAGHELALAVSAVAQKLGMHGIVPCAHAGSVIVKGQFVARMFLDAATALGLHLDPVTPVTEPAQGALRLARALAQSRR
jgi:N-acetylglucosamine kinase-like BadF-type ATPase